MTCMTVCMATSTVAGSRRAPEARHHPSDLLVISRLSEKLADIIQTSDLV